MATPLSIAVDLVKGLLARVEHVKTNRAGWRRFDSSVVRALKLLIDALKESQEVVDMCFNTSFINAMLYHGSYASSLQQAAKKLERALSQIPVASLGMIADIQSDIVALSTKIRNSKFEERSTTAHQTIALKDAFEKAFYQSGQGVEEVKNLIQELLQQHTSSKEERENELKVLKECALEARKNKENQQEFEINQIIGVISESLRDIREAPRAAQDLENCLCCPITKQIMKDPVVLKDSGMTYERSSITRWLEQGHRHDPLTNIELASTELIPNHTLRNACQTLLRESESSSSALDALQKETLRPKLTPGLYEGHGKIVIDSSIVHVLQLLIVEPNGKVHGYTLYKNENIIVEENVLEVGSGEWNDITNDLSFGDNQYSYNGVIDLGVDYRQFELFWNGKLSKANIQDGTHDFALAYSRPLIQRSMALHPTILEMEHVLETRGSRVKYDSKMVLSLEVDSTIGGWMWFESVNQGSQFIGRIIEGRWEYDGTLSFRVYFSHDNTPLNSDSSPTNHSAIYKISGNLSQDERFSHCKFVSVTTRVRSEGVQRINMPINVPLDNIPILEYSFVREASTPWYHLHPNPVKLFNMSRTYELRNADYSVKANFDLSYGSFAHFLRTWGRTPLHIAAWNNSINIVKELLDSGTDVNVNDNNGQSPLHHATSNNSIDVVNVLIEKGANVNIRDKNGRSPLYMACDKNFTGIIKVLLDNGASLDFQDDHGWSQLHNATKNKDIGVVKKLISNGASLDIQDNCGKTPLYIAFENNLTNIYRELLNHGANIDLQGEYGTTLLHHSIKNNDFIMFKELILRGANINLQDNSGCSSLHFASHHGHIDVVKELILNGANVNIQGNDGASPLYIASRKGHIAVVKELIANGAEVNLQENNGESPLYIASQNGHIDVVKELILNGANVNIQGNDGASPLYIASRKGHIAVVKELIANGAEVNLQENNGESPLYIASQNGHIDVVKELIANGAGVNLQENNGASPLYIASQNGHVDVVKELIANGAEVDLQENNGASPLIITSQNGHINVVKELIANGAEVNLQNNNGSSPLHIASQNGHIDVVQELIANCAEVNLQKNNGASPLYIASRNGHVDVVKELIANGAGVNLQDKDGWSPLYIASQNGHIDIVKELIANGAEVKLQRNNGFSPLHIASRRGRVSVVHILLDHGASKDIRSNVGQTAYDVACTEECFKLFDESTISQLKALLKP